MLFEILTVYVLVGLYPCIVACYEMVSGRPNEKKCFTVLAVFLPSAIICVLLAAATVIMFTTWLFTGKIYRLYSGWLRS